MHLCFSVTKYTPCCTVILRIICELHKINTRWRGHMFSSLKWVNELSEIWYWEGLHPKWLYRYNCDIRPVSFVLCVKITWNLTIFQSNLSWKGNWFSEFIETVSACWICIQMLGQLFSDSSEKCDNMVLLSVFNLYSVWQIEIVLLCTNYINLIPNFCCVLNVVFFLLGDSPAFEFYVLAFLNTPVPSS